MPHIESLIELQHSGFLEFTVYRASSPGPGDNGRLQIYVHYCDPLYRRIKGLPPAAYLLKGDGDTLHCRCLRHFRSKRWPNLLWNGKDIPPSVLPLL
jgi:hypothetical protein